MGGAAGVARDLLSVLGTAEYRMSLRRCKNPTPGTAHNQILGQGEFLTGLSKESLAGESRCGAGDRDAN